MSPAESEQYLPIGLVVYLMIGIPVVRAHIRQQKMTESVRSLESSDATGLVYYTLGVLWPLLLLGMILNYLQPPPSSRRKSKDSPKPEAESSIGKRE